MTVPIATTSAPDARSKMPRRELWKELAQADHHGVYRIDRIAIEHDGRTYAYGYGLTLGRLFVADGMR